MRLRDRIKALIEPLPFTADQDEFDPFSESKEDPPPEHEGDDSALAGQQDG